MISVPISNRTLYGLSDGERYILMVWCMLAMTVNFLGNSLILVSTIKYQAIKLDKISIVLIQNIAVSDILMGVNTIHPTFVSLAADRWIYGDILCYANHFLKVPIFVSAILLICAMNISKLMMLLHPLRTLGRTARTAWLLVAAIWTLSCVIPVTHLIVDPLSVTFDYRAYRCHYVFRKPIWGWLRTLLLSTLMVSPNLVVLATTISLIVFVKKSIGKVNLQGAIAALYVAMVYIVSCAPVGVNQAVIATLYSSMSPTVHRFFFTSFFRFAFFVTFLNGSSNVFVYLVSLQSFREFVGAMVRRRVTRGVGRGEQGTRRRVTRDEQGTSRRVTRDEQGMRSRSVTREIRMEVRASNKEIGEGAVAVNLVALAILKN